MTKKEKEELFKRWNEQVDLITKYTGLTRLDMGFIGWESHKKLYAYVLVKEGLLNQRR